MWVIMSPLGRSKFDIVQGFSHDYIFFNTEKFLSWAKTRKISRATAYRWLSQGLGQKRIKRVKSGSYEIQPLRLQ